MVSTWQVAQPIFVNSSAPCFTSGVAAAVSSLAGAFSERMKLAKWSISSRLLSVGSGRLLGSVIFVGSVFGTVVVTGGLQMVVTSVFCRRFVIPISFKYASPANASRLACWSFQPKRPMRSFPSLSGTSTLMACPQIFPCDALALFLANFEQSLVGDGFHVSVAERVRGEAGGAHGLRLGHAFLNLGADGAVIHQVPVLDDLRSVIDRDLRILELAVCVEMSHAQLGDLAGGSA